MVFVQEGVESTGRAAEDVDDGGGGGFRSGNGELLDLRDVVGEPDGHVGVVDEVVAQFVHGEIGVVDLMASQGCQT